MKTKDIAVLIVCFLVIGGAIFWGVKMFMPAGKATTSQTTQTVTTTENAINGTVNDKTTAETLSKLEALKSYGETNLNNIGRVNPFAPLN